MKKTDYQVVQKSQKVALERAVTINEKASNLRVEINLNPVKGMYSIKSVINFEQITGETKLDSALIKTVGELILEAIIYGENWKETWQSTRSSEENSLGLDLD